MKFQHIRNATVKIEYGGKTWLIDPFFGEVNCLPPFAGKSANPLVPLPMDIEEIISGVDYVAITHLHPDHFDERAQETIPKSIPLLVQKEDYETIRGFGFQNVNIIDDTKTIGSIKISRVDAQHGEGEILNVMGFVSGYVFQTTQEETLYITGDTVWCETIKKNMDRFNPKNIICNAGGNTFIPESNPFKEYIILECTHKVIMGEEGILKILDYNKDSNIIAVHIGALDHETVSRTSLRNFLDTYQVDSKRVFIPEDGEVFNF
ncbi:MBL fold metallo-hydrolase [Flagellimonas sp. 389]|uniref:MBL fold metallo-hydrolase n=1 Tax=Flagellimonas sp. 389 TaxID=2835862 RepID=UPI001BD2EDE6|nr:MBL fold metallo-hydrolase [Flagellimonas sp. 389]MBS9462907.1 MBL fold metallo-hydrolase [Flagellimonas sp. 389]